MEKALKEFAAQRCEKALEDDAEYMKDEQSGNCDQDELDARAQVLCYLQGFKDFLQLAGMDDIPIEKVIGSHGSQER